ncbi:MAG: HlyD family secretion protein [Rhodobacteraceae bacterium]|nr:HlyD family secretion protein [Paracoccaceae bacterium]
MSTLTELPGDVRGLLRWGGGAVAGFVVFGVAWAMLAQITTTVCVPGMLSPSAPTYEVQHETGGRTAALHVEPNEEVETGDLLFQLDVTDERVQLDALRAREEMIKAEVAAIAPRLGIEAVPSPQVETVSLAYDAP